MTGKKQVEDESMKVGLHKKDALCQSMRNVGINHIATATATARVLHLARSAVALGAMSKLSPLILRSFSTVRCHVSFGRPLLLLP